MGFKDLLKQIPNDVSGDGKRFASALKLFLQKFSDEVKTQMGDDAEEPNVVPEQVTRLRLTEEHSTDSNGMPQNNILVEYDTTNVADFASAQIWVKEADGEYQLFGNSVGAKYIITGAVTGKTYMVKVVAVNKQGNGADFDEAPQATITIKGSVLVPGVPRQFVLTWDEDGPLWEWLHEDNGYVDFFELRLDANAGEYSDKLLDRTRAMYSRANPGVRSGTAYLFVRNLFGTYSEPAVHQFSKAVGSKPSAPILEHTLNGVSITMDSLPEGYVGWKLIINGEDFESYNRKFLYYQFSGKITVKYCFFDDIGDGEWSDEVTETIKTSIDLEELPEINYEALDQTIKDAIDAANNQQEINEQMKTDVESTKSDIKDVKSDIEGISADISEIQGKVEENSSAIIQTDERIETIVTQKVTVAKGEIKGEIIDEVSDDLKEEVTKEVGSQIKQEADNITATVYEQVKGEITEEVAAQVSIKADEIKSTVYTKTEVDGKLGDKANSADVYTKEETASQISQTAEEVKVLVYKDMSTLEGKVDGNTADIQTNASDITANADSITALNTSIAEIDGRVTTNAGEIEILNDKVLLAVTKEELNEVDKKVAQNTASIEVANDSINSVVSSLDGTAEESGFKALEGIASSIKQTDESITSVVAELNKEPSECSYTAITQLKDAIDLSVKGEMNGEEIVSRINIAPEGVTIEGKYLHVTGDTVFDGQVIFTDAIGDAAVVAMKIADGAVLAAKIAANAVTADKIEAGAVTANKVAAKAITAEKIDADAVRTEHIQSESIIGEHISAGAISAEKLYAGDINLAGALALVGGAVRLDENGLKVNNTNGTYTLFNENGMSFYDSAGNRFAGIGRFVTGVAKHGQTVKFDSPWDKTPSVTLIPTNMQVTAEGFSAAAVFWTIYPSDISVEGFTVNCYSTLGAGSSGLVAYNKKFLDTTTTGTASGSYSFTPLDGATQVTVAVRVVLKGFYWSDVMGAPPYDYVWEQWANAKEPKVFLYEGDKLIASWEDDPDNGYYDFDETITLTGNFTAGATLKVVASGSLRYTNCDGSVEVDATLVSATYNVVTETVLTSGEVMFIATDGNTSAYSIE